MPREKKRLTSQELEEHTMFWATERLEEFRELADKIFHSETIPSEQKEVFYNGIAFHTSGILELIAPLRYDEEHLLDWAQDFVDEYLHYNELIPTS